MIPGYCFLKEDHLEYLVFKVMILKNLHTCSEFKMSIELKKWIEKSI